MSITNEPEDFEPINSEEQEEVDSEDDDMLALDEQLQRSHLHDGWTDDDEDPE